MVRALPRIDRLDVSCHRIATEGGPESDGTLVWDSTTIVVVMVHAGTTTGLGYTYGHRASAALIEDTLAKVVVGRSAAGVEEAWYAMRGQIRNFGGSGVAASAIAAVDAALWDLKARLLDLPLLELLGAVRDRIPAYGSGGFTSLDPARLAAELRFYREAGFEKVKIKVGRNPEQDPERVRIARKTIGDSVELFVDANGAYTRTQALEMAERFAEQNVRWFEEPVSSDDIAGLAWLRQRKPSSMAIAAGEYAYVPVDFLRLLEANAVDVLQADATRCMGITGLRLAGALAEAHMIPLSTHTAQALHTDPACAIGRMINVEYFYDHMRVERLLFDGLPELKHGSLYANRTRPGHGLTLKPEAERFRIAV